MSGGLTARPAELRDAPAIADIYDRARRPTRAALQREASV